MRTKLFKKTVAIIALFAMLSQNAFSAYAAVSNTASNGNDVQTEQAVTAEDASVEVTEEAVETVEDVDTVEAEKFSEAEESTEGNQESLADSGAENEEVEENVEETSEQSSEEETDVEATDDAIEGEETIDEGIIDEDSHEEGEKALVVNDNGISGYGYDDLNIAIDASSLPDGEHFSLKVSANDGATYNNEKITGGVISSLSNDINNIQLSGLESENFTIHVSSDATGIGAEYSVDSEDNGTVSITVVADENAEETEEVRTKRIYKYTDEANGVKVIARLEDPNAVPDSAELVVTPIKGGNAYDAYMDAINENSDVNYTENNALLYDVAFIVDGKEYEPEVGKVTVIFEFEDSTLKEDLGVESAEDVSIVHLPLNDAVLDEVDRTVDAQNISAEDVRVEEIEATVTLEAGSEEIRFETEEFSVYGVLKNSTTVTEIVKGANETYSTVLGEAVNYGIVANEFNPTSHMDTNYATGILHGSAQLTGGKYTGNNNPGNLIIGEYDGSGAWTDTGSQQFIIYTTEDVKNKLGVNMKDRAIYDTSHTADELKKQVSDMVDAVEKKSIELFNEPQGIYDWIENPDDNNSRVVIDITDKPDGTYYFNLREGEFERVNGFRQASWFNIKITSGQTVVINIPDETFKDDKNIVLQKFTISVDGKEVDSSTNDAKADAYMKRVIWNLPNAKKISPECTLGVFLAPNADVEIGTTSTGWLVCNNMLRNAGEWHGTWQEMPSSVPDSISFKVKKTLENNIVNGTALTESFRFNVYETESDFVTKKAYSETKEISASEYISNAATVEFSTLDFDGASSIGWHYYVIEEVTKNNWKANTKAYRVAFEVKSKTINNKTYYNVDAQSFTVKKVTVDDAGNENVSDYTGTNSATPTFDFVNSFSNPKGSLKVTKETKSASTGNAVNVNETFYFTISDGAGEYDETAHTTPYSVKLSNASTNSVTIDNLPLGTYTVTETDANGNSLPNGFKYGVKVTGDSVVQAGKTAEVTITNAIYDGKIELHKLVKGTSEKTDAKFKLYMVIGSEEKPVAVTGEAPNYVYAGLNSNGTELSTLNGDLSVSNLPVGQYKIKEISNGVEFEDPKVEYADKSLKNLNARFEVTKDESKGAGKTVVTALGTNDSNLVSAKASGNVITYNFLNIKRKFAVKIVKTKTGTNVALKDIPFTVYEGNYADYTDIKKDANAIVLGEKDVKTDSQGQIVFKDAKYGTTYTIVEKIPEGYVYVENNVTTNGHDTEGYVVVGHVTINNDTIKDTKLLTVENVKYYTETANIYNTPVVGKLFVNKKDGAGQLIQGGVAKFSLKANNKYVTVSGTAPHYVYSSLSDTKMLLTTVAGSFTVDGLPAEYTYELVEEEAPFGFVKSAAGVTVQFTNDSEADNTDNNKFTVKETVDVTNTDFAASVYFDKLGKDANGNLVKLYDASQKNQYPVFTVVDEAGNTSTSSFDAVNKRVIINVSKPGKYTITESSTLGGYKIVTADGKPVQFIMNVTKPELLQKLADVQTADSPCKVSKNGSFDNSYVDINEKGKVVLTKTVDKAVMGLDFSKFKFELQKKNASGKYVAYTDSENDDVISEGSKNSDGTYSPNATTGKLSIENLEWGEYQFVEKDVYRDSANNAVYKLSTEVIPFTISNTDVVSEGYAVKSVSLENKIIKGYAELEKVSEKKLVGLDKILTKNSDSTISGVKFDLYKVGDDNFIEHYTTDKDGKIKTADLEFGSYYFVELPEFATDESGNTISVQPAGYKYPADLATAISYGKANYEFSITKEGLNKSFSGKDSIKNEQSEGSVTLVKYAYVYDEAQKKYVPAFENTLVDGEKKSVPVTLSGAEFTLYYKGASSVFQSVLKVVQGNDTYYKYVAEGENGVITTDNSGRLHLENLPWGEYYLEETKAPAGYKLRADFSNKYYFVIDENNLDAQLSIDTNNFVSETPLAYNVPIDAKLTITKKFIDENGKEITDPTKVNGSATFTLFRGTTLSDAVATDVTVVLPDLNSKTPFVATVDGLKIGYTYYLKETAVTGDFEPDNSIYPANGVTVDRFNVSKGNESAIFDAGTVVNRLKTGDVEVKKVDESGNKLPANSTDTQATFELVRVSSGKEYKVNVTASGKEYIYESTDSKEFNAGGNLFKAIADYFNKNGNKGSIEAIDGTVYVKNLPAGNYKIYEISAPEGYSKTKSETLVREFAIDGSVNSNGTKVLNSFKFVNSLTTAGVQLVKKDGVNDQGINGVTFELYKVETDEDGTVTYVPYMDGESSYVATTKKDKYYLVKDNTEANAVELDGVLSIQGLSAGKYALKEKSAPDCYEMSKDYYVFTITAESKDASGNPYKNVGLDNITKTDNIQVVNNDERLAYAKLTKNQITGYMADGKAITSALPNAEFKLFKYEKNEKKYVQVETYYTNEIGLLKTGYLTWGDYYLKETAVWADAKHSVDISNKYDLTNYVYAFTVDENSFAKTEKATKDSKEITVGVVESAVKSTVNDTLTKVTPVKGGTTDTVYNELTLGGVKLTKYYKYEGQDDKNAVVLNDEKDGQIYFAIYKVGTSDAADVVVSGYEKIATVDGVIDTTKTWPVNGLEVGDYYFVELPKDQQTALKNSAGYVFENEVTDKEGKWLKNATKYSFTIAKANTKKISEAKPVAVLAGENGKVVNDRKNGIIELYKFYNIYTYGEANEKVTESQYLNGVKFELSKLDVASNSYKKVAEKVTGETVNGIVTFDNLEWGTYKAVEILPEGYVLPEGADSEFVFVIDGNKYDYSVSKKTENNKVVYAGNAATDSQAVLNVQEKGEFELTKYKNELKTQPLTEGVLFELQAYDDNSKTWLPITMDGTSVNGKVYSFTTDNDTYVVTVGGVKHAYVLTGTDGKILVKNLEWGTYRFAEIAPADYPEAVECPEGYEIKAGTYPENGTYIGIESKKNTLTTEKASAVNKEIKGTIEFTKYEYEKGTATSANPVKKPLEGAEFDLYRKVVTTNALGEKQTSYERVYVTNNNGKYSYSKELTDVVILSDASGKVRVSDVPYGIYAFKERPRTSGDLVAYAGYIEEFIVNRSGLTLLGLINISDAVIDYTGTDSSKKAECINTEYSTGIYFNKVDADNHDNKLENVVFKMYQKASGDKINEIKATSDAAGKVSFTLAAKGEWFLEEYGYVANVAYLNGLKVENPTDAEKVINDLADKYIARADKETGCVVLEFADEDAAKLIPYVNNNAVYTVIVDDEDNGKYDIELKDVCASFTETSDNVVENTVKTGKLLVTKYKKAEGSADSTKSALEDMCVTYELFEGVYANIADARKALNENATISYSFVKNTDSSEAVLSNIPFGTYTLFETGCYFDNEALISADKIYKINENPQSVIIDKTNVVKVYAQSKDVVNEYYVGKLTVVKSLERAEDGDSVEGVSFKITRYETAEDRASKQKAVNTITYTFSDEDEQHRTDLANKQFEIADLDWGYYTLEEVAPAANGKYLLDNTVREFVIDKDNLSKSYTGSEVIVNDKKQGFVKLDKVELVGTSNKEIPMKDVEFILYKKDSSTPVTSISDYVVESTDSSNNKVERLVNITNVRFITNEDGELEMSGVYNAVDGTEVNVSTAKIGPLDYGKYFFVENLSQEQKKFYDDKYCNANFEEYEKNPLRFEIKNEGETTVVDVNDTETASREATVKNIRKLGSITVTKKDKDADKLMSGVTFKIYKKKDGNPSIVDAAANLVGAYNPYEFVSAEKTGDDGMVTFENLEWGVYVVSEVVPDAYELLSSDVVNDELMSSYSSNTDDEKAKVTKCEVTISADVETLTVTYDVENGEKNGELKLKKKVKDNSVEVTDETVNGGKFDLYKVVGTKDVYTVADNSERDDILVANDVTLVKGEYSTANDDKVAPLTWGEYYFVEEEAPKLSTDGYLTSIVEPAYYGEYVSNTIIVGDNNNANIASEIIDATRLNVKLNDSQNVAVIDNDVAYGYFGIYKYLAKDLADKYLEYAGSTEEKNTLFNLNNVEFDLFKVGADGKATNPAVNTEPIKVVQIDANNPVRGAITETPVGPFKAGRYVLKEREITGNTCLTKTDIEITIDIDRTNTEKSVADQIEAVKKAVLEGDENSVYALPNSIDKIVPFANSGVLGSAKIGKVTQSGKPLEGVEFTLYEVTKNDNGFTLGAAKISGNTAKVGNLDKAYFTVINLPMGDYCFIENINSANKLGYKGETVTVDGVTAAANAYVFTIANDGDSITEFDVAKTEDLINYSLTSDKLSEVVNEPKVGKLTLKKYNKNNKYLAGCEFSLYATTDNVIGNEDDVLIKVDGKETFVTKAEPFTVSGLSWEGAVRYYFKEVSAPVGYTLYETSADDIVTLGDANESGEVLLEKDVTVTNDDIEIEISKRDITGSTELANAKLAIFRDSESLNVSDINSAEFVFTSGESVKVIKTGAQSETGSEFAGFEPDVVYVLHEIEAPAGYALATDIRFKVDENGVVYVASNVNGEEEFVKVAENGKTNKITLYDDVTSVIINKDYVIDESTNTYGKVVGATLQIEDAELSADAVNRVVATWQTTGEGKIIKELALNHKYILKETNAPNGFVKAAPIKFTLVQDTNDSLVKVVLDGTTERLDSIQMVDDIVKLSVAKKNWSGNKDNYINGAKLHLAVSQGTKDGKVELTKVKNSDWISGQNANGDICEKPVLFIPEGVTVSETEASAYAKVINVPLSKDSTYYVVEDEAPAGFMSYTLVEAEEAGKAVNVIATKNANDGSYEYVAVNAGAMVVFAKLSSEANASVAKNGYVAGAKLYVTEEALPTAKRIAEFTTGTKPVLLIANPTDKELAEYSEQFDIARCKEGCGLVASKKYYLFEESAPAGFARNTSYVEFTASATRNGINNPLNGSSETYTTDSGNIDNRVVMYDGPVVLSVSKRETATVDENTSMSELAGAKLRLTTDPEGKEENTLYSWTSKDKPFMFTTVDGDNSNVNVSSDNKYYVVYGIKLTEGQTYYVHEDEAPAGHEITPLNKDGSHPSLVAVVKGVSELAANSNASEGSVVVNNAKEGYIKISGSKNWIIPDDFKLSAPVEIRLYRDSEVQGTCDLSPVAKVQLKTNDSSYEFGINDKLSRYKYNKDGSVDYAYTYWIKEYMPQDAKLTSLCLVNGAYAEWNKSSDSYAYMITPDMLTNGGVSLTGFDFTNRIEQDYVDISGTKTWILFKNPDGTIDETKTYPKVTIFVTRKAGETGKAETVNGEDGKPLTAVIENGALTEAIKGKKSYEFKHLPKYELETGKKYIYETEERADTTVVTDAKEFTPVQDGYSFTNTPDNKVFRIDGIKNWVDGNRNGALRPNVSISLYRDIQGKEISGNKTPYKQTTLKSDNTFSFENLVEYAFDIPSTDADYGRKYVYTIDEVISYKTATEARYTYTVSFDGVITGGVAKATLTNTIKQEYIDISGVKKWNDAGNAKDRPTITINLLANGTVIDSVEIPNTKTSYSFSNLPKYNADGSEIKYSVEEEELDGYTSVQDGYNFTNTPSVMRFIKVDEAGVALEGAVLAVYDSDNKLVKKWTTDGDYYEIEGLKIGAKYTLKELSAPSGYAVASPISFTVEDDEDVEIRMVDKRVYGIARLTKTDAATGETLSGAEFALYTAGGNIVSVKGSNGSYEYTESGNTTLSVASDGQLSVKGLPYGDYYFKETKAPEGYIIGTDVENFTIDDGSTDVSVVMRNTRAVGAVRLTKTDAATGTALSGAVFELYAKTPTNASSAIASTLVKDAYYRVGTYVSDASGNIYVGDLPWDDYYFVEVTAPEGFVTNKDSDGSDLVYTFSINSSSVVGTATSLGIVTNTRTTGGGGDVAGVRKPGGVLAGVLGVRAAPSAGVLGERIGPVTGDVANIALWIVLLLGCIGAMIAVAVMPSKRRVATAVVNENIDEDFTENDFDFDYDIESDDDDYDEE